MGLLVIALKSGAPAAAEAPGGPAGLLDPGIS